MSAAESIHSPADAQELTQIVHDAAAARTSVQIVGAGSKATVGFPQRQTTKISTARFDRIVDYDPSELVITVGAGARLSTIEELLAAHEQMLAFDPFDFALVSGSAPGASTIGGIVAAGFAGSRRLSAGNVRDHLLGFTAVSGRGEQFVAGGRVVKNVTGYDLSKLMCGSWGQLAVLTQLTLKVAPRPKVTLTLRVSGLNDATAFRTLTRAVRSQADVAAAAYVPQDVLDSRSHTLLRLEGFGPSVDARAKTLADSVDGAIEHVPNEEATRLWRILPRLAAGDRDGDEAIWRLCIPSTQGVQLCAALRDLGGMLCVDWGGALIWARLPLSVTAANVRTLAENAAGHATLMHAPFSYRSQVSALHPESRGVAALTERIKAAFDPAGILDPQRFANPGV